MQLTHAVVGRVTMKGSLGWGGGNFMTVTSFIDTLVQISSQHGQAEIPIQNDENFFKEGDFHWTYLQNIHTLVAGGKN